MKTYADTSVRRSLQIAGDLTLVLWVWFWIVIADNVHDATLELATPGRRIDRSATDLAGQLREAGEKVSGVPFVGDEVRVPVRRCRRRRAGLADAGQQQVSAVSTLANWLGVAVALIPILVAADVLPSAPDPVHPSSHGRPALPRRGGGP